MSLELLVTFIIVILLPGTGVLCTLAMALGRGFRSNGFRANGFRANGFRARVAASAGCTFGFLSLRLALSER